MCKNGATGAPTSKTATYQPGAGELLPKSGATDDVECQVAAEDDLTAPPSPYSRRMNLLDDLDAFLQEYRRSFRRSQGSLGGFFSPSRVRPSATITACPVTTTPSN